MTMVEKVARALCVADGLDPDWNYDPKGLSDAKPIRWMLYADKALAAIRAMREPSAAMIDAGVAFALNITISGEYRWSQYVADMHRNMTGAAISSCPSPAREPTEPGSAT